MKWIQTNASPVVSYRSRKYPFLPLPVPLDNPVRRAKRPVVPLELVALRLVTFLGLHTPVVLEVAHVAVARLILGREAEVARRGAQLHGGAALGLGWRRRRRGVIDAAGLVRWPGRLLPSGHAPDVPGAHLVVRVHHGARHGRPTPVQRGQEKRWPAGQ